MLLQTPIPTELPPGRKRLTCCVPGCSNSMIVADYNTRLICHHHYNTHNFPRDEQTALDLGHSTLDSATA